MPSRSRSLVWTRLSVCFSKQSSEQSASQHLREGDETTSLSTTSAKIWAMAEALFVKTLPYQMENIFKTMIIYQTKNSWQKKTASLILRKHKKLWRYTNALNDATTKKG